MKHQFVFGAIATSVLATGSLVVAPDAHALDLFSGARVDCDAGVFEGTTSCEGPYAGNDSNQIDDSTELFNLTGWTELTKIDTVEGQSVYDNGIIAFSGPDGEELKSGINWSFKDGFDSSQVADLFFSVKGGSSFSAYLWDESTTSGTFNTGGIVKGNGRGGPGLSHLSVYYRAYTPGPPNAVPTPAAILPALFGMFGAAVKRNKSVSEEPESEA